MLAFLNVAFSENIARNPLTPICNFLAFVARLTYLVSLMSTCLLSYDRFLSISRNGEPSGFRRSFVLRMLLVNWLVAVVVSQPYDVFANLTKSRSLFTSCNRLPSWLDGIILGTFTMCADALLLFCATRIIVIVRASELRIRPATALQPTDIRFDSELRTATSVVIVAVSTVITRTPMVVALIVIQWETATRQPPHLMLTLWLIFWCQICVNPLLYVTRNPHVSEWLRLRKALTTSYQTPTPSCLVDADVTRAPRSASSARLSDVIGTHDQLYELNAEDIEIHTSTTIGPSLSNNILLDRNLVSLSEMSYKWSKTEPNSHLFAAAQQKRGSELSTLTTITELSVEPDLRGSSPM